MTGSLGKRLFTARLELIGELDQRIAMRGDPVVAERAGVTYADPHSDGEVRAETARIAAPRSRGDEPRQLRRAAAAARWWRSTRSRRRGRCLTPETLSELAHEVAGLPSELPSEDEEAKRFDLLLLGPAAGRAAGTNPASRGCATR